MCNLRRGALVITAKELAKLVGRTVAAKTETELDVGGCPGLKLRVKSSGVASWTLRYRPQAGGQRRVTLGAYPLVGLAEARERGLELRGGIVRGADPAAEKKRAFARREGMTFGELADEWTSGRLAKAHPDHVKLRRDVAHTKSRLANHVLPIVGSVPVATFDLDDAELVMRTLSSRLAVQSRRHVALTMHRLMALAVFPLRLREANPLPPGWLPKVGKRKASPWLYPKEEAKLIGCADVPLIYRVAYAFLAREGMRKSEALALTWADVDLELGAVSLDRNKTDEPRSWALGGDVARALRRWRVICGSPDDDVRIFDLDELRADGDEERKEKHDPTRTGLRGHLRITGVDRAQLYERTDTRNPINVHSLRATFVTLALSIGKSEAWITDRTGHKSSTMVYRYKRAARHAAEIGLGWLTPMERAIPELKAKRAAKVVRLDERRRKA
jgi:integrase